jgi:hypothetical protein
MRRSYLLTSGIVLTLVAALRLTAQVGDAAAPQARPATDIAMPAGNVAHGQYIAEHVAMCVECHSGRDADGNIVPRLRYHGAPLPFLPPSAAWATQVPRNGGLPGYTDAAAMRLLTQGSIGRDGRQLKLPMPRFRMTPQDAADVIAFLRAVG